MHACVYRAVRSSVCSHLQISSSTSFSSPFLPKQISCYRSPLKMAAFITPIPCAAIGVSSFSATTPRIRPSRIAVARPSCTKMLLDLPSHTLAENPAFLQTIAKAFLTLNMPSWLVKYGHPALMTFMVLGMGVPGAVAGWVGRTNENRKEGNEQKKLHESIMIAFFFLAILGGSGGTLSVAMQGYDVWQSPHFISGGVVLALLAANSVIAYSGFTLGTGSDGKGRLAGRKFHSYFGIAGMSAFLVHGALGIKILLE